MTTADPTITFKLVRKTDSRFMRAIGFLLNPINKRFMTSYWTTIGRTIYVPSRYDGDLDWGMQAFIDRHAVILAHEVVHVHQGDVLGVVLMSLLYLGPAPFVLPIALASLPVLGVDALSGFGAVALAAAPLSVGLAYGRWRIEREAYMINIMNSSDRPAAAERAVQALWRDYGFTWPKPLMRKWFGAQIARLEARENNPSP